MGVFEGVIHRVLVGYLGRYVKDFHKEQLKFSIWNEEVLLENVELIPEAFDYLQLPFALKQGRVGRLSIKISWRKLSWDCPIDISLEDVFVSVAQRDDQEWSLDAVERREFSGKKAKLAAAELAKLSRCVCDNQTGKSFFSYITAKVLESIQVSVRNFHVQYSDMQSNTAKVLFGLKFSSLSVKQKSEPTMLKPNSAGLYGGIIKGLAIYCTPYQLPVHSTGTIIDEKSKISTRSSEDNKFDYLLQPFDVSVSVMVNKSGKIQNDLPQYSVSADVLAISLNDVQLQQILILSDYLSTSNLREKYGRYRPWGCPLASKQAGWQKIWWQYAQKSVLSDIRRKLKKTSWRDFGNRLKYRRKYIDLYKRKLVLLQQEQSIDQYILQKLEQMEKESDIDDILSYRSAAEHEMQKVSSNTVCSNLEPKGSDISVENSRNEEHSAGRPRSWLNWLSRGMLGAGGTDDSGQFAGVVSDEVVKDIFEATKFDPPDISSADVDENDKKFMCAIKFKVGLVSATLSWLNSNRKIADLMFKVAAIECKLWEDLATFIFLIKSVQMISPYHDKVILQVGQLHIIDTFDNSAVLKNKMINEEIGKDNELTSCKVQAEVSPNREVELSVKVTVEPIKATWDLNLFVDLAEFFNVFKSFEFQHQRVLLSLNGIQDVKTRLVSKAEYILSSHKRLSWEVTIHNVILSFPWRKTDCEQFNLALELECLHCMSKHNANSLVSYIKEHPLIRKPFSSAKLFNSFLKDFQVQGLYNYLQAEIEQLELKFMIPQHNHSVSILEKLSASITSASCIIDDESISEQLEVGLFLPAISIKFSPSICEATVALIEYLDATLSNIGTLTLDSCSLPSSVANQPMASVFGFSIAAHLNLVDFHLDLGNDVENCSILKISLHQLDFWHTNSEFQDCFLCIKALEVVTSSLRGENNSYILISSGNKVASSFLHREDMVAQHVNQDEGNVCTEGCFLLHYESCQSSDLGFHRFIVELNDSDIHCHPHILGLLAGFYDKVSSSFSSFSTGNTTFSSNLDDGNSKELPHFGFDRYGYTNFDEVGSSDRASISLGCFPFVSITNSGALGSLDSSLRYSDSDWRKFCKLVDSKLGSPRFSWWKGSRTLPLPMLTCSAGTDGNMFDIEINVCRNRVHFHDRTCIIGTVALPTAKSSILICGDLVDILCSTKGLMLTCPWLTKNLTEFLWGPSLPNVPPILNIRVRKGSAGSLVSQVEVSIGIQHAYCILPAEYLAIIIGYFSLPDWSLNLSKHASPNLINAENQSDLILKFEILDSTLVFPVELDYRKFIRMEIQQLYCSFIPNCDPIGALKYVPPENAVPAHKLAKRNDCLNIFGRSLILSFLTCKGDELGSLVLQQNADSENLILIAPLNADVWVRLPCENGSFPSSSSSTCIMGRIFNCELLVDERCYTFDGLEALLDVVNQLSDVDKDCKHFTSDVSHFLQWKRSPKVTKEVIGSDPDMVLMEVQCCVESSSIKLCPSTRDLRSLEPVVNVDMQFTFSASLINEKPIAVDTKFSFLKLYSMEHSITLAQCNTTQFSSLALHLCFNQSADGMVELKFSLPSLEVWLHMFAWTAVLDTHDSFTKRVSGATNSDTASSNAHQNASDSPCHDLEHLKPGSVSLNLRSKDTGLTVYIPVMATETAIFGSGVEAKVLRDASSRTVQETDCKFFVVTAHSKSVELSVVGSKVNVKSFWEKLSGTVGLCEHGSTTTWPIFQISYLDVMAESIRNQMNFISLGIQCDRVDLWFSHRAFCCWHGLQFESSEALSPALFGCMDVKLRLRKLSLLVSDERWSCSGPLLEILLRSVLLQAVITEDSAESTITSDFAVNYNNIHKVLWEPFVEPWEFQIHVRRKQEVTALLSSSITTELHLTSTVPFNLNFTESFVECIFRMAEMVKDSLHLMSSNDGSENQRFSSIQLSKTACEGRCAPYILQNLTSLPLVYYVFEGPLSWDEFNVKEMEGGKSVQPDASVPIYLNQTPEELLFRYSPVHSSEKLYEKQFNGAFHHFMSIQLDGMSLPSAPFSMDLVGRTYFEVDFSKASTKMETVAAVGVSGYDVNIEEFVRSNTRDGFLVPVVVDVSVERYTKLIRFYSTVVLYNETSMPLQFRFDIPFGVAPKVLDPVYPGQQLPLPLHLAEAGRMRWCPFRSSYLWSEVHDLSNIISQESKIGFLRSFVCYPSYPSNYPFRCCISVENLSLPLSLTSSKPKKRQLPHDNISGVDNLKEPNKRFIHLVTLSNPFTMHNYLPCAVSLTVESGGVNRTILLSEVKTPFHHIDPSHDLGLEFYIKGYRTSSLKFPRAELFNTTAKFSGNKFSMVETITFYPENSDSGKNLMGITVEKIMDAFSGARELFFFAPFLLYNCTGLTLVISESASEMKGTYWTIPSCYNWIEQEALQGRKAGLKLLSSVNIPLATSQSEIPENCIVSRRKNANSNLGGVISKPLISSGPKKASHVQLDKDSVSLKASCNNCSTGKLAPGNSQTLDAKHREVNACMFSPHVTSSVSELMVKLSRCYAGHDEYNVSNISWSAPFPLVPPSGSSTILVPPSSSSSHGSVILSVTSSALEGPLAGRTQAVTFQPRYVISNACTKDLCYKQKGSDASLYLGIGQHSYLLWTDTTRELLVSICYDEPGWQWSGSFSPDNLGDTQVKIRNYDGSVKMIRVEVQNADVSNMDEKITGSFDGNSGTNLILLSEDDTGFVPYRIDNFSKERLRVYQQKCESFDTIIHPYTSHPFAWDEPCYRHRLTVEVPGERIVGYYDLDNQKEYAPVFLKATPEKSERTLLISVHAEGATKVLSIVDASFHALSNVGDSSFPWSREKSEREPNVETRLEYKNIFSVSMACIGISVIDSFPQELLFACAKNVTLELRQSLDRQKLSFQVSSLQIDNQLVPTPYPVILSFSQEYRSGTTGQRAKDDSVRSRSEKMLQVTSESTCEPVISLAVATWGKKDLSLLSFEYIILRIANFHLELEQKLLLSLLDLLKAVSSIFQSNFSPLVDSTSKSFMDDVGFMHYHNCNGVAKGENHLREVNFPTFKKSQISNKSLPTVVPIGAPWQQIYLSARRHTKIYVELFDLAPIKFSLSFSSSPWTHRNAIPALGESLIHRGLMALADIEGAQIYLKQLTFAHQMGSLESMQDILIRHYSRQLLHEMYKVFGSAGVIGNPMGFARSLGLGIRDFLSVPTKSILQSPSGLVTGMAQGTTSLVSNTVYALSDAATQFTKAAHKGIVAFTFDDQSVATMEEHHRGVSSHTKGVINEVLEGLTGLLQSPIKEAEKHGLPGVLSGIALGVTGLVARPAVSILEVTGKTAQSIRNKSRIYQGSQRCRLRFPRPLSRDLPLKPYTLEEAIGTSVLLDAEDGMMFKDERLVQCKSLKQVGKFAVLTEKLMLIVNCSGLENLGKPEFRGVPTDPEWTVESKISLDSVIHADTMDSVLHIVGSNLNSSIRLSQHHTKRNDSGPTRWNNMSTPLPFFQTNLELASQGDAKELLETLLSTIEQGKGRGWGSGYVVHQSSMFH